MERPSSLCTHGQCMHRGNVAVVIGASSWKKFATRGNGFQARLSSRVFSIRIRWKAHCKSLWYWTQILPHDDETIPRHAGRLFFPTLLPFKWPPRAVNAGHAAYTRSLSLLSQNVSFARKREKTKSWQCLKKKKKFVFLPSCLLLLTNETIFGFIITILQDDRLCLYSQHLFFPHYAHFAFDTWSL